MKYIIVANSSNGRWTQTFTEHTEEDKNILVGDLLRGERICTEIFNEYETEYYFIADSVGVKIER